MRQTSLQPKRRPHDSQVGTPVPPATYPRSPQAGTPVPPNRHFKLTVTYDGTQYAGWQLQPNGKTVQEVVELALTKIDGRAVRVHGSGRTDAGVHARGQVANCSLRTQLPTATLLRALN